MSAGAPDLSPAEAATVACSIEGCVKPASRRGWCHMHYYRWRMHGTTDDPYPALEARFLAKVNKTDGCWLWTARISKDGYGRINVDGAPRNAHRVAYELFVGPIPPGHQIDHLCHTDDETCPGGDDCLHRRCVNPAHLEPVTGPENNRRSSSPTAVNGRKTECSKGHRYDEANTYVRPDGYRDCRECRREHSRRSRVA